LTIAAEIGQQLLQENQALRNAYDELIHSDTTDTTDRISSMPNTPTKFSKTSPLSPSPKKHQFNMSDYVESLELKNHDALKEIKVLKKQLSQSDRNNLKLVIDLDSCMKEINRLKNMAPSLKSTHKGDRELLNETRISYAKLEKDYDDAIEKVIMLEKELEKVLRNIYEMEINENLLKNQLLKALESKKTDDSKKCMQLLVDCETQTSKAALTSVMVQAVDKEKESLSFFKSLAFINLKESQNFKQDQLFIPCRFPTSPQGGTRSKTIHLDEWISEMPDELSVNPKIPQSQKPVPVLGFPKNERLRFLMGQFVNYVYDLIL
jgi:hypothetical protein